MNSDLADKSTAPGVSPVLSERIGYLLAKLHHRWATDSAIVLEEAGLGLSGLHFGALSVLAEAGPISQQELGEQIRKDRTTIVAVVDELEQRSLVERHRNPADRRAYALELTAEGHAWLQKARPLLVDAERRLLSTLEANEQEHLVALLQRVLCDSPSR